MPTKVLIGHGAYRTEYGSFKVPNNIEIHFFVDDGNGLDNSVAASLERSLFDGKLSTGISDEILDKANKSISGNEVLGSGEMRDRPKLFRDVKTAKDVVKNYKLENPITGLPGFDSPDTVNALRLSGTWAPEDDTFLKDIVAKFSGLATAHDPLILQWSACRTNFSGEDEVFAPLNLPNKKKCYLSTAACGAIGLKDDCLELETLRFFRDNVLSRSEAGIKAIEEYYSMAPAIVDAINQRDDRALIYFSIFENMIKPSVNAVISGNHDKAFDIYFRESEKLKAHYVYTQSFQVKLKSVAQKLSI